MIDKTGFLGALKPKYDIRDYRLAKAARLSELPTSYICGGNENNLPEVKNQGGVSSCVAHATASILEFHTKNQKLSTNFIYGIEKYECGYDGKGMYLSDACRIVEKYGDCLYEDCPGNTEIPNCYAKAEAVLNDKEKMERASSFKVKQYFTCTSSEDIKQALYKYGPMLCSLKWWDDLHLTSDGVLYRSNNKTTGGYHAIMVYGWNETGFLCQNSWGKLWGKKGRFICPYDIKFAEAKGLVDDENAEFQQLKRNKFLDVVYKIINIAVNFFRKLFN